jgi:hypothetical protein
LSPAGIASVAELLCKVALVGRACSWGVAGPQPAPNITAVALPRHDEEGPRCYVSILMHVNIGPAHVGLVRARPRISRVAGGIGRQHRILIMLLSAGLATLIALTPSALVADTAVSQSVAQLSAVRAAAHPGYDRLVFQFSGPLPAGRSVRWVPQVVADPSGKVVPLGGDALLRVVFTPATAHTETGQPTYGRSLPGQFDLPVLRSVRLAGDFEDVLSFGVGLWQKTPLSVFTLLAPPRLVIDIAVPAKGPGELADADNGRLVYLRTGERVTVALRTCVDCGDYWSVSGAPDRRVMRVLQASVAPLPHATSVVGFPFESRWVLQATGAGLTALGLAEFGPGRPARPIAHYMLRFAVTS